MRAKLRMLTVIVVAIAVAAFVAAGCGSDEPDEVAVPSAGELAATLLVPGDLDGDWTVTEPPDDAGIAETGVVTDAQQDLLPRLTLCEAAGPEATTAAEELPWHAFRQIELAVDDPIEPPADTSGHMVFVQEFLTSGTPDEIEATFGLLRDGMTACLGDIPAGEEGPGTATAMALPDVGDDRFGALAVIEEAGGQAEWRLHTALVRQDAVLMSFVIVDIRAGEGVEPFYTDADIATIVETAVDRL